MILGRVVGQLWATKKSARLAGRKLLIVQPLTWHLPDHDSDHIVAVDPVGAEIGQDVIVCMGLPARWAMGDTRYPVEASIAAIVDGVELFGDAASTPAFQFASGREPLNLQKRPSE